MQNQQFLVRNNQSTLIYILWQLLITENDFTTWMGPHLTEW